MIRTRCEIWPKLTIAKKKYLILLFLFSPTSSSNNKKIASQDDLGSEYVGVENTPLSSLPGTTIPRTAGVIPATSSVTALPGLVGGIRDDSSITSGSSGFGSLPKRASKNDGNKWNIFDFSFQNKSQMYKFQMNQLFLF